MTHCSPVTEKCRLRPIEGSATFTIETSSTVMKKATQMSASARQRRGSGVEVTGSPVRGTQSVGVYSGVSTGHCRRKRGKAARPESRHRKRCLVPEMAPACEHHARAGRLHGVDHVLVALGAAGLDDRGYPRCERVPTPVREGAERGGRARGAGA